MIRKITIHNIALIEKISLDFHTGMHVLSGETGAGKSIIVDAVSLLLGGRADKDLIRNGCEKASVEAEFDAEGLRVPHSILAREGIDDEDETVILYREISRSGRNTCRINGVMVPVAVLKELSASLLNLHGQSEHQFLAEEEKHRSYLDLMGDEAHRILILETQEAFDRFITNHRAYAKLVKMNENRERRLDQLKHELQELQSAGIRPGEEAKLTEESKRLNKAFRIHEKLNHIYSLASGGGDGTDVLHGLQTSVHELNLLSEEGPEFASLAKRFENLSYELEDMIFDLNELNHRYQMDPYELEETENRLESVRKVLKKYGPSESEVLQSQEKMEEEYRTLEELEDRIRTTGAEHKKLLGQYRAKAKELSESRKSIASVFENQMMQELSDLGMEHTVIKVSFESPADGKPVMPSPEGDDRIRFMISPNPGEPLKPIARIASGGELSRLMLAIKTIESGRSGVPTMIFDEIDTGISGRMAQAVAEKMIRISRHQQVLCISHLPQIAAAADYQYRVQKHVFGERTRTEVESVSGAERVHEIARMISGAEGITEDAEQYASRMLEAISRRKKEL